MPELEHAIVIGGSIAGMLAARVLSDFYRQVTIVERDRLTDEPAPRKAVPQGRHIHALLARGHQVLDGLFPGLMTELEEAGAPVGDFGADVAWYFGNQKIRQTETGMTCVSAGRPLLEQRIRRRVRALPNVRVLDGAEATGLMSDAGRTRVTGIGVHRAADPAGASRLDADLVVDSGGRGSRLPAWLADLGYPEVERDAVNVGLGYATVYYDSFPEHDPLGKDLGAVVSAIPGSPRGAIVARMPGKFGISLIGLRGDHPPRELGPFLDFLATLPLPEVHRAAVSAEPAGPPASFHYPASVRHRYERVKSFPDGLIVLGDGFASFNPIYGQGMTVAAIGADLLRRHIGRHAAVRPAAFLRELAGQVAAPWALATGTDLAFPETEGTRTLMTRFGNAYIPRLRRAAVTDPVLSRAFLRVAGLVESPATLFRPGIVARTLAA